MRANAITPQHVKKCIGHAPCNVTLHDSTTTSNTILTYSNFLVTYGVLWSNRFDLMRITKGSHPFTGSTILWILKFVHNCLFGISQLDAKRGANFDY